MSMARFASCAAALLVTGTLLLTGCLDGKTSEPVGPTVRVDISTSYDPELTRPEDRQYGFEPGTPARNGAVLVELSFAVAGADEREGGPSDRGLGDERVEAGSALTIPEGRSQYGYSIPLDEDGETFVRVELRDRRVNVTIDPLPASISGTDCDELHYALAKGTVVFTLEESRSVTLPYGVVCPD